MKFQELEKSDSDGMLRLGGPCMMNLQERRRGVLFLMVPGHSWERKDAK